MKRYVSGDTLKQPLFFLTISPTYIVSYEIQTNKKTCHSSWECLYTYVLLLLWCYPNTILNIMVVSSLLVKHAAANRSTAGHYIPRLRYDIVMIKLSHEYSVSFVSTSMLFLVIFFSIQPHINEVLLLIIISHQYELFNTSKSTCSRK